MSEVHPWGCNRCGCYKLGIRRGLQDAAEATYADNLRVTADREAAERARQDVNRWHER